MTTRYVGSFRGIGRMLQRPGMQLACRKAVVEMKGIAEASSPHGDPADGDRHPGLYARSFDVVPIYKDVRWRGQPHRRPGARLINTADHAWRVEHGDGRVPRYAVLSRAMDAMKAVHGA
jgi:hypothetical protein